METQKRRKMSMWEVALFLTPLLVLLLVFAVSRLETVELPKQQLIERGKPLFTMGVRFNSAGSQSSMAIYHAVRMPNGTYKVYWVQQSEVAVAN